MTDYEKFIISRWAYSVGQPVISDAEYMVLFAAMRHDYPNDAYVTRSWSSDPCPKDLLEKYGLQHLIQAVVITDKTESIPSLGSLWEIQKEYGSTDEEVTVSYKHDGWNFQASYYNGDLIHQQTRGRTSNAMTISDPRGLIPTKIPKMGKVTVIMEITVSDKVFEEVKREFGNVSQRGSVSTLLANADWTGKLEAHAFKIRAQEKMDDFPTLQAWGFKTPMYFVAHNYSEILESVEKLSEYADMYGTPTDGAVVAGTKTRAVRVMHWEEPIYKSFVIGYKEEFGPQYSSVGLEIYPIKLQNSTQSVVTITNLSRVIKSNLRIGYPVAFRIKSSAIADFDEEATRLLHKQFENDLEAYQYSIKTNELLKQQGGY